MEPMILRSTIAASAIAATLITPASAADQVIPQVKTAIQESREDCGQAFILKRGFLTRRDVNGDGIDDFILNYEYALCGGSEAHFCGTGGCLMQIFASLENKDYVEVMNENAFAVHFKRLRNRPAMIQYQHGTYCGRPGAEGSCQSVTYWNGVEFSPAVPFNSTIPRR
jgi:hypothetical protein